MKYVIRIILNVFLLLSVICVSADNVPVYTYEIVKVYFHDPAVFTQGLVYEDGFLYESSGRRGKSFLRKIDLAKGKVVKFHKLSNEFFGEGTAIYQDKISQDMANNDMINIEVAEQDAIPIFVT